MPIDGAIVLATVILSMVLETSATSRTFLLETGQTLLPSMLTASVALIIGVAAIICRKRLPAGMGAGTLITAVSGAAILLFAKKCGGVFSTLAIAHVLTGLALLWYALGRIAARATDRSGTAAWGYAALFCGLAALGCLLRIQDGGLIGRSADKVDFLVLLLFAGLVWIFRTGAWSAYPAIALLVVLLESYVPDWVGETSFALGGWGLVLIGMLCLASVLAVVLDDWRQRRRMWLRAPHESPAPLAPPKWLFAGIVGVCLCVGLGGVVFYHYPATPFGLWLAAIACFVVGHILDCERSGEMGLMLLGEGIVTAALAWGSELETGVVIGFAVAGGYLIWLARFWNQQLDAGRPWTTAGRLIPVARRLGYAACLGAVPMAILGYGERQTPQGVYSAIITIILLLLAIRLAVRDGGEHRRTAGAAAACHLAMIAAIPLTGLLHALLHKPVTPVAGGALAIGWLAVMAAKYSKSRNANPADSADAATTCSEIEVYNALLFGVIPVASLILVGEFGFTGGNWMALVFTLGAIGMWGMCGPKQSRMIDSADGASSDGNLTAGEKQPR